MKPLIKKGAIFISIILCAITLLILLSINDSTKKTIAIVTNSYEYMDEGAMLTLFNEASTPDKTDTIIFGDSICRQLFEDIEANNPHVSMLASSAALMIPGQYTLLETYLKAHPNAQNAVLIIHPLPLTRSYDADWSYRYSVMTNIETDTYRYLDNHTQNVITGMYSKTLTTKPIVYLVEKSPIIRKLTFGYLHNNVDEYQMNNPYEFADIYISKMYELCQSRGVNLYVYSAPVSDYYDKEVSELSDAYDKSKMKSLFPNYYSEIVYYPKHMSFDNSHFSESYASKEALASMRHKVFDNTLLSTILQLN